MRTSNRKTNARRLPSLVQALLTAAVCIVVDVALCFALEPYAGQTELMWSEYRNATDIDTILVGSSVTAYGLSPMVLDAKLGSRSFNMGTPGQSAHDALASVKCAREEHDIQRAIICVGYETILEYPFINSSVVYTQAKCLGESPVQIASDISNLLFYDYYFKHMYSLSCLFPWTYDHVEPSLDAALANIRRRMSLDTLDAAVDYAQDSGDAGWHYYGQGYGGYEIEYSPTREHSVPFASHPGGPVIGETMDALRELFAYCSAEGIKLYVIGAPYLPSVVLEYGDAYWQGMAEVQQMAQDANAVFFDLNMAHRSLYDPNLSHFFNQVHLNHHGAEVATSCVADLIKSIERGENVSELFYPYTEEGWKSYQESLPRVDSVEYTLSSDKGSTIIEAHAVVGSDIPVSYCLEAYDEPAGTWKLVRDWGSDNVFNITPESGPISRIRISARATNGKQDVMRSVEGTAIV